MSPIPPTLHVLLKREELDPARLRGKIVVVLDVLFATTTIVHAFDCGAAAVWPAVDEDQARQLAAGRAGSVLAGEYLARALPGFGPATPLALSACGLDGVELVYCTTNGTRALAAAAAASAGHVYVGALLNGAALARHLVRAHPGESILVVCAGSMDRFNLEDFHGAGHLVGHLRALADFTATDAALAAALVCGGGDSQATLAASRVGRMMAAHGLADEVAHAGRHDSSEAVPVLVHGCLRPVAA